MNKSELIEAIAATSAGSHFTKAQLTDLTSAVFSALKTALSNGSEVRLVGFGTFKVESRKATTGRNPRTGETIQIAARKVVKFTPGTELKASVN